MCFFMQKTQEIINMWKYELARYIHGHQISEAHRKAIHNLFHLLQFSMHHSHYTQICLVISHLFWFDENDT